MVYTKVKLQFADSKIDILKHFNDVQQAIRFARINLWDRCEIMLYDPRVDNEEVFVTMVSEDKIDNVGHHLQGVSRYLLKSDFYKEHRVGTRLLKYVETAN